MAALALAQLPPGFIKCADEGGTCTFTGPAQPVYYGATSGSISHGISKTLPSPVKCNNTTFPDPFSGVVKACWIAGGTTPVPPPTPPASVFCSGTDAPKAGEVPVLKGSCIGSQPPPKDGKDGLSITGPPGPAGQSITGPAGVSGKDGQSITGPAGPQGLPGKDGTSGGTSNPGFGLVRDSAGNLSANTAVLMTLDNATVGLQNYCKSSGSMALSCKLPKALTVYAEPLPLLLRTDTACTNCSLAVNGLVPISIKDATGKNDAPVSRDVLHQIWYDGAVFRLLW